MLALASRFGSHCMGPPAGGPLPRGGLGSRCARPSRPCGSMCGPWRHLLSLGASSRLSLSSRSGGPLCGSGRGLGPRAKARARPGHGRDGWPQRHPTKGRGSESPNSRHVVAHGHSTRGVPLSRPALDPCIPMRAAVGPGARPTATWAGRLLLGLLPPFPAVAAAQTRPAPAVPGPLARVAPLQPAQVGPLQLARAGPPRPARPAALLRPPLEPLRLRPELPRLLPEPRRPAQRPVRPPLHRRCLPGGGALSPSTPALALLALAPGATMLSRSLMTAPVGLPLLSCPSIF